MSSLIKLESYIYNYSHEQGDYLNGYIYFSYKDHVIFSDQMKTDDMLFTWSSIFTIIRDGNDSEENNFSIGFLDNAHGEAYLIEKDGKYGISFEFPEYTKGYELPCVIPKEDLLNAFRDHFIKFMNFLQNANLPFKESLYEICIEDYKTLVNR